MSRHGASRSIAPPSAAPSAVLDRSEASEADGAVVQMSSRANGRTDVGRHRPHNEDNLLVLPDEQIYVVADGMGGHASGEVASQLAIEEVASFYRRTHSDPEATWPYRMNPRLSRDQNRLQVAVQLANTRIHDLARGESRFRKMGTTLVALALCREGALVAHVGDSRAYRFRAGALAQLTEDHSLLNEHIRTRHLTPAEIEAFPHKNVIVRAVGMSPHVLVDLTSDAPQPGDQYLLCSDGLSGMVSDLEIGRLLGLGLGLEETTQALIDSANHAGGHDNITAVIVRLS